MIGCQKCGTTSLVADMMGRMPISCGSTLQNEPRKLWKEKHFFDNGECATSPNGEACFENDTTVARQGMHEERTHFLSHYPACDNGGGGHNTKKGKGGHVLPEGAVSMDATPRYMRVPAAPLRIKAMYGPELSKKLTFVVILRDPETRAWSWFRFFALNAVEGKSWARDQLKREFWEHHNDASFRRWTLAQISKLAECKARGVAGEHMWPECDSETGMFAGLYSLQLKHWLAHFDPSQFVVIPMDCYTHLGPKEPLAAVATAAGVGNSLLGKSLADLDPSLKSEHEKRLKAITGGGKDKAGSANRHGEQPIPIGAAKQVKAFFRHEGEELRSLFAQHPTMQVVSCPIPHFFEPCNATHCLPSYDESVDAIDQGIAAQKKARGSVAGGAWWRSPLTLSTATLKSALPLRGKNRDEIEEGKGVANTKQEEDDLVKLGIDDEYSEGEEASDSTKSALRV